MSGIKLRFVCHKIDYDGHYVWRKNYTEDWFLCDFYSSENIVHHLKRFF